MPLLQGWQDTPQQGTQSAEWLSAQETAWAAALPPRRRDRYRLSRAWMRRLLGDLFSVDPRDLPLQAPPGLPPELARGWGGVSLSHCCDALLVGWAPDRLGVDLERRDRAVPARALAERFFLEPECRALLGLEGQALREAVLDLWVVKEAAIKWQHGSIARDLSQWSCRPEGDRVVHRTGGWTLAVQRWQVGDWTLAMTGSPRTEAGQAGILCLA